MDDSAADIAKTYFEPELAGNVKTDSPRYPARSLFWTHYFFACIMVVGAIGAYGIFLPIKLMARFSSKADALADTIMARGIAFLLFLQPWLKATVDIEVPGGGLLVSNHRSNLDVFFLLSRVKSLRILAKRPLFRIPFLAMMMRLLKQIPIGHGVDSYWSSMKTIQRALRGGEKVHVFPEMKRCMVGYDDVDKFHHAPFRAAFKEKVLVYPIVIAGTDVAWPRRSIRVSFRAPIVIRSLPPIDPRGFESSEALALYAHERIAESLKHYVA